MKIAQQLRKQAAKLNNIGINSGSDLLTVKTKQLKERAEKLEDAAVQAHRERSAGAIRLANRGTHAKVLITLEDAAVETPDGTLLFRTGKRHICQDDRIVLLGRNGVGKTRFIAMIRNAIAEPGSIANIKVTPSTVLGYSDQALSGINGEDTPLAMVSRRFEIGEQRARSLLAGAGVVIEMQDKKIGALSGGQRSRLMMLVLRLTNPNFYLLDEPTNYLDLEGTLWLENYVSKYPHTVLLISHDRDLLNRAVNSIVHLDQKKLTFWRGGYDQFERQLTEQRELQEKSRVKQEAQRKHMESFVERFRAKASKARQAQSRLKALEKLKPIAAVVNDTVRPFSFPEPVKTVASPIVALNGVNVGYTEGDPILKKMTLRIDADDRIALLGANGNGKSTFAKLLAGRLKAETGSMTIAPGLKVAIFAQHQLDDLRPEESAYEHVRRLMPDAPEAKVRARVAQFGLSTEKMNTCAKDLSGGEKARLLMGLSAFEGPNLFILDEPTNHLDIDSRESLIHALNDFPGAVILISHDRHLLEATADRLWLVKDGAVNPYDGDLEDYKTLVTGVSSNRREQKEADKASKADRRREAAQRRAALEPLAKEIRATEALMDRIRKR
ncbi:MAG: ABC-F family ATP-binding cassette domain-containing protein, partial [Mesorhizobium sp.]